MSSITDFTTALWILGALVLLVNLLTQVIKQVTYDKLPSALLAVIVSQAVTLVAFFAYCSIQSLTVYWYYVVAAVIAGFLVAYAAMYGYDALKEKILDWYASKDSDDTTDTTATETVTDETEESADTATDATDTEEAAVAAAGSLNAVIERIRGKIDELEDALGYQIEVKKKDS